MTKKKEKPQTLEELRREISAFAKDAADRAHLDKCVVAGATVSTRYYREKIVALYNLIGADRAKCQSCGRTIWWVRMKSGKLNPFTVDGVSHFADCDDAARHRRDR